MQPERIQAYVLSSDYFILSSILGSEKRGELEGKSATYG